MGQIILRLFFYGAVAFVPDSIQHSTGMTAYLLNVTGDCKHTPLLTFKKERGSVCGDRNTCRYPISSSTTCCGELKLGSDTYCVCKLINEKVVLAPELDKVQRNFRLKPGDVLPAKGDEDNFAWLLRIVNIDTKANQAKTLNSILRATPRPVTAYIDFSWAEAQACHIDQNKLKTGGYKIDEFEFKSLQGGNPAAHTQALAEYAGFSGFIDAKPTHVSLESMDGKHDPINILLDCSNGCPDLLISNNLSGYDCMDEDIGKHFVHYYNLSRSSGSSRVPYRTRRNVPVDEQYSCGGKNGPPRPHEPRFMDHPLAQARGSLIEELRSRLCAPIVRADDLLELDGVIDVFGKSSGELDDFLDDLFQGKLEKCKTDDYSSEVINILNRWRRGIASRVICPMAMFDP